MKIRKPNFVLYNEEIECPNICFWYLPDCLVEAKLPPEQTPLIEKVAPLIKGRMMERGEAMISYMPIDGRPSFFRLIISNSAVTKDDIKFLFDEINTIGKNLTLDQLDR